VAWEVKDIRSLLAPHQACDEQGLMGWNVDVDLDVDWVVGNEATYNGVGMDMAARQRDADQNLKFRLLLLYMCA